MDMEFFAESLAEICAHSLVAPGRPLRWVIIANPYAGGFVIPSRRKKCHKALEECLTAVRKNPRRENCGPADTAASPASQAVSVAPGAQQAYTAKLAACGLVLTKGSECGAQITKLLIEEAEQQSHDDTAAPFYLIITAGGDGTSLGALSVLYHASASARSNIAVLRLPMGTGNDGADSPQLAGALDLLIKPSRIEYAPALRLLPAPGGPTSRQEYQDGHIEKGQLLAFNILSVGLDAFVTHMTNKMKGKLPGDFYKLWVDIAALLYDKLYTVDFLDVKALDQQGNEVRSFREKLLLVAVGISGHRTYGSQKKILPDDRNVCAMKQMPLLRKLALKGLFNTGGHVDKPEAILFNAHRVEFSSKYPMLAQMDGEAILLQTEDYPAVIELTDPVIPVLKMLASG